MCDCPEHIRPGWKGWIPLPQRKAEQGSGPWFDLTHTITEDLSRSPAFPKPVIGQIVKMPKDNANVTEIQMVVHHGTHVDAPRHFLIDGPAMEEIPMDRLYGPAVIWQIEKGLYAVIEPADFEAAMPKVQPGDMVLLDTGWAQYINTDKYEEHASLSPAAAEWLVDHQGEVARDRLQHAGPDVPQAAERIYLSGSRNPAVAGRAYCRAPHQSAATCEPSGRGNASRTPDSGFGWRASARDRKAASRAMNVMAGPTDISIRRKRGNSYLLSQF